MKELNQERIENKIMVRELQNDLANMTINDMLPLVEQRKKEFEDKIISLQNKLSEKDSKDGFNSVVISELLFEPISKFYSQRPSYTPEKLQIAFDLYREMIVEANARGLKVVPTKSHFSRFCGFSTSTYDNYMDSSDANMRNLMEVIDDYIFDIGIASAQHREIELATSMFRAKVEQRKIEPTSPQVHIVSPDADMEKIMYDIQRIKSGKKVIDYDVVERHSIEHNATKRNE